MATTSSAGTMTHAAHLPQALYGENLAAGDCADALTSIMDNHINLSVWQRTLEQSLEQDIALALSDVQWRDVRLACQPKQIPDELARLWRDNFPSLRADISLLCDMFECLFDASFIALRMVKLTRAMCPRFHVDKIPCRLVTTYTGAGTEWLRESDIERQFLGRGAKGKPDVSSGLIKPTAQVQQISPGHVALLKGDAWPNNEGRGIVHRSPSCDTSSPRMVMTLDFASN